MGTVNFPDPVKLIFALMGQNADILASARTRLSDRFGAIDSESEIYPFTFSDYYTAEMGASLVKQFVSFAEVIQPNRLAEIKPFSNELELQTSRPDNRPGRGVNIDPGYINAAKLVLATTKDYSHRIYLDNGIYAEVTLQFRHGAFRPFPWTYADYQTETALAYFKHVRTIYMEQEW